MRKILIVDDAIFMRKAIETVVVNAGYEVIGEACDGNEAVAAYERLLPDLVTMDITMPERDGIDALRIIKKHHPEARVVMVTAMGQEHLVKEAIVAGANGFVVKPFREKDLIGALEKVR